MDKLIKLNNTFSNISEVCAYNRIEEMKFLKIESKNYTSELMKILIINMSKVRVGLITLDEALEISTNELNEK